MYDGRPDQEAARRGKANGITMKHRERVELALNHAAADRCPMQISFTPEFAARLAKSMDLSQEAQPHNPHGGGNTYVLERALEQDMLLTSVGWANEYYQDAEAYTDEWGVGWKRVEYETPFGTGHYTEMTEYPLSEDAAIDTYQPPDPLRPDLYEEAKWVLDNFKEEYWIVGVTVTTIFETAWALRGYEKMFTDFSLNPEMAERILDIPYQYHLTAAKQLTKMGVDMIWIGDDMGAQESMLISPRMWRRFFKPRMANFIAEIKAINPRLKVAYHSDGNIIPIIPDLIEIGLDVLNPVQPASMDPKQLKEDFGDHLCFWGSIDEQHTLPFGSPADVAKEVTDRISVLGKDGGLILGPTHHIQLDTPLENFWSMLNTILQTPQRNA
jgi:uroporphyrinogen decarboxylase